MAGAILEGDVGDDDQDSLRTALSALKIVLVSATWV